VNALRIGIEAAFKNETAPSPLFIAFRDPEDKDTPFFAFEADFKVTPFELGKMISLLFAAYCVQNGIPANQGLPELARALDETFCDTETEH